MASDIGKFEAILFPSDGRAPSIVEMMTSPVTFPMNHAAPNMVDTRLPHPEVFMDYIAEGLGCRAWRYQLVESLDYMKRGLKTPYILFYPTISRDGMPFPINRSIRDIQGSNFREEHAWRGNIVVVKYCGDPFSTMMDMTMADFPLLKNYFLTHPGPN